MKKFARRGGYIFSTLAYALVLLVPVLLINIGRVGAFSGFGDGSTDDPYQITTCDQLQEIADSLSSDYVLAADIDCSATATWNSGAGFVPIDSFTGVLDGQNHEITGLTIDRPSTDNVGLFGNIDGFGNDLSIANLHLTDVSITGSQYVGGLVGRGTTFPLSNASVSGTVSGWQYVGGLAGGLYDVRPQATHSSVDVTASGRAAGGLIGFADSDAGATDSYATGSVSSGADSAGGLIGGVTTGIVTNTYATGSVAGKTDVGGLIGTIGTGSINDSFATGQVSVTTNGNPMGGLLGYMYDSGHVNDSYYDTVGTGQSQCEGSGAATCTGIDTVSQPNYFINNNLNPPLNQWDFTSTWLVTAGYPVLGAVDAPPGAVTGLGVDPNADTGVVGLSWTVPATSSYPITSYSVQWRTHGTSAWANSANTGAPASSYQLSASPATLPLGQYYDFRVAAVSDAGIGDYDEVDDIYFGAQTAGNNDNGTINKDNTGGDSGSAESDLNEIIDDLNAANNAADSNAIADITKPDSPKQTGNPGKTTTRMPKPAHRFDWWPYIIAAGCVLSILIILFVIFA